MTSLTALSAPVRRDRPVRPGATAAGRPPGPEPPVPWCSLRRSRALSYPPARPAYPRVHRRTFDRPPTRSASRSGLSGGDNPAA
ncbi:hypothetical protein CA984_15165 [Streptosporangium minutum]|uniref:Uncharacterized protein n=1 Tax=Streptosporangium minutum TaxID=569862 RepID=A0A243RPZ5_9ACTN|nr:hypothetical protein CA984_15165 [Streptosporangium minutum]